MKSGTFKSDISGTFVSDTSGTFGVIYSTYFADLFIYGKSGHKFSIKNDQLTCHISEWRKSKEIISDTNTLGWYIGRWMPTVTVSGSHLNLPCSRLHLSTTTAALNGSALGKEFSANAFGARFAEFSTTGREGCN